MDLIQAIKDKQKSQPVKSAQATPKSNFLSEKIISLLNFRINEEEKSSRIYKAMSLWLNDKGYFNAAKLWEKYSGEELKHAEWSREHLLSFDIRPETRPIEDVPNDFKGLDDIIYKTLEHEILITEQCKQLSLECLMESDVITFTLGQKYVAEQIEEVDRSFNTVNLLEVYGTDKLALALLDHQLAEYL